MKSILDKCLLDDKFYVWYIFHCYSSFKKKLHIVCL
jgi:hypothetical protein